MVRAVLVTLLLVLAAGCSERPLPAAIPVEPGATLSSTCVKWAPGASPPYPQPDVLCPGAAPFPLGHPKDTFPKNDLPPPQATTLAELFGIELTDNFNFRSHQFGLEGVSVLAGGITAAQTLYQNVIDYQFKDRNGTDIPLKRKVYPAKSDDYNQIICSTWFYKDSDNYDKIQRPKIRSIHYQEVKHFDGDKNGTIGWLEYVFQRKIAGNDVYERRRLIFLPRLCTGASPIDDTTQVDCYKPDGGNKQADGTSYLKSGVSPFFCPKPKNGVPAEIVEVDHRMPDDGGGGGSM
jgi:hypothetical protein